MRKPVKAKKGESYDIELEESLLEANRRLAFENQTLLAEHGVRSTEVLGSVGSGKTSLIEQLVQMLKGRYRIAVLNGDLTTTLDAERVERHNVEVVQINTGKECHLDAKLVKKALHRLNLVRLDLIFIENVGNLICPAEFPLGSDKRVVVISLSEGPYMVVKHPFTFLEADIVVINKIDLAGIMGADVGKLEADVHSINPNVKVVRTNCKTGEGIVQVTEILQQSCH